MLQSSRIMLKSEQQPTHCDDPGKIATHNFELPIAPTGAFLPSFPDRTLCVPAGHFLFRVSCIRPGIPSQRDNLSNRVVKLARRDFRQTARPNGTHRICVKRSLSRPSREWPTQLRVPAISCKFRQQNINRWSFSV